MRQQNLRAMGSRSEFTRTATPCVAVVFSQPFNPPATLIHAGAQVIYEFDAPIQLPAADATDNGTGAGTPPGGGILQGSGITRINYQPSLSPIPTGFIADKGNVFGVRSNGKSYGWQTTARTDTIVRGQHPYPQFDSFNQAWLNNQGSAGVWEIDVPNGTYAVVVVMGDAASTNQTNNITVEGQTQTDPDPAVATPPNYRRGDFDGYAVTANVSDGKLTLNFPASANNPKLCFIEIGPTGSTISQADRDRLAAQITDAVSDTGLPAFPKAQPTPRLYVYGSYVDENIMMVNSSNQRFYYHSNHLYSVAALTDGSKNVVERYRYDAYGNRTVLEANGINSRTGSLYGQQVGFTGRYLDTETGMYYFRARYYSGTLGRFVNRDLPKDLKDDPVERAALIAEAETLRNKWRISTPVVQALDVLNPDSLDGYHDSFNLYGANFIPNKIDPEGRVGVCIGTYTWTNIVMARRGAGWCEYEFSDITDLCTCGTGCPDSFPATTRSTPIPIPPHRPIFWICNPVVFLFKSCV
jgi:RHS repeat-associated protein